MPTGGQEENAHAYAKHAVRRPEVDTQGDLQWRFPERQFEDKAPDIPGLAICPRRHAYLDLNRWCSGEQRHRVLQALPGVRETLCPGCTRVERRLYEGEVAAVYGGDPARRTLMLNLIHYKEARERVGNPTARIALLEEHDDELYLLTITQFLARRIGTELPKAFHGELSIPHLPYEKFTHIRWRTAP